MCPTVTVKTGYYFRLNLLPACIGERADRTAVNWTIGLCPPPSSYVAENRGHLNDTEGLSDFV